LPFAHSVKKPDTKKTARESPSGSGFRVRCPKSVSMPRRDGVSREIRDLPDTGQKRPAACCIELDGPQL
jgi:hypothetical protein